MLRFVLHLIRVEHLIIESLSSGSFKTVKFPRKYWVISIKIFKDVFGNQELQGVKNLQGYSSS